MTKPRIYKQNIYWWYQFYDEFGVRHNQNYFFYEGAKRGLEQELNKMHYRINAYNLVTFVIDIKRLTVREALFCKKLQLRAFFGTTKRQYGWLKGLAERTNN